MGSVTAKADGIREMPVYKDPTDVNLVGVDWTSLLTNMPDASRTVVGSVWSADSGITVANDDIVTGNLKTVCTLSGGTAGTTYTVSNTITTDGTPALTFTRSLKVTVGAR